MFKRIYIELSNYCNLNCVFCTPSTKNNRMLTLDEFKRILAEVSLYTKEVCLHILGEPTIHPNFLEIVKLINEKGLKVMLSTNGITIPKLENALYDVKIDTWNISLHSTYQLKDSEKNEYFRTILPFINNYQKKYISTFHLRLWADTNKEIKANNQIIKHILFNYYAYKGEVTSRIRLKDRIILAYEEEFLWPSLKTNEYSDGYCLGGKSHIGILANGEVVLCCLDAKGLTSFGNILKTPLKDILVSEKFQKTIKAFKDNKCHLELCKHCTYKKRGMR